MHVVRNNRLEELPDDDPDVDFELTDPTRQYGSHTNMIPLQSAVQTPRLFYGGRFVNQALAIEGGEPPLIQNLDTSDPEGRSFDEIVGEKLGAIRAKQGGRVIAVKPDYIRVQHDDGKTTDIDLYNDFAFNQKGGISSRPVVKKGDTFTPGQVLAASSYTDDAGVQNMGLNARIGLVPWKGFSMDDAIPISESFAKRLSAIQYKVMKQDSSDNLKTGLNHYRALFPTKYTKEKLEMFDSDGLVRPGTVLDPGDPILLATMPRTVSSAGANVGKLSKALSQQRRDASQVWHGNQQATVVASRKTKNGFKVVMKYLKPTEEGDKIVLRQGAKATVSKIIPDDQMPRTEDGLPLDAMLNPLSLVSRANPASQHELRLGKIAKKLGMPMKIPSYLPKGQNWNDYIDALEAEHGVQSKERIYDPETSRYLSEPITVGYGFVNKLHHTSESKQSSRGSGSYDCFDDITEVMTARGWVAWPEVTDSDLLCTPAEDMLSATFEKPSRLVSYDFTGELYRYESRYLNWAVTENHEFLTYGKYGKATRLPVTTLQNRVRISVPQFGFVCPCITPSVKIIPATTSGRKLLNRKDLELDFLDYASFMGWWASEGSVQLESGRVYVWQTARVNPEHSAEIYELLTRMFGRPPMDHKQKGWRVDDRRLAEFLVAEAGDRSYTKRIPRDIIGAGDGAVSAFMDAYVKGDGTDAESEKKDGRTALNITRQVGSVSRQLMDDMQEMLMRRGKGLIAKQTMEEGRDVQISEEAKVYKGAAFYSGAVHLKRRKATVVSVVGMPRYTGKWSRLPYSGKVYCATTRTGLLVVRRDGKPVVTGNSNEQPSRGSGEMAGAKRYSGLENYATLSSGAYALMRENSTLRGQENHDFWRALRADKPLPKVGEPFVWHKFRAILAGAGMNTKETGKGRYRLAPFTDRDLDDVDPIDVENGEMVNLKDLSPVEGGLFDGRLLNGERWGRVRLPRPIINPAMEDTVRVMLGLTKNQLADVLAGRLDLAEAMGKKA
jgi:hypothetical protein